MANSAPSLQDRLADPYYYLADFSFSDAIAVFAWATPEHFRTSLLLTVESFPAETLSVVGLDDLLSTPRPEVGAGLRYLFHLPFCGSTFLTRWLETSAIQLRDPVSLYAVFVDNPDGEPFPPFIEPLRSFTLSLAARPFPTAPTVVRAAGSFPEIMVPLCTAEYFAAAVFLFLSLEDYAAQVLKTSKRRADCRALLARSKAGYVLARTERRSEDLPDAELVALSWLYSIEQALAVEAATGRMAALDGARLFQHPRKAARAVCNWYGVDFQAPETQVEAVLASRHAKTGDAYSMAVRRDELEAASSRFGPELDQALAFVRKLDPEDRCRTGLRALEAKLVGV